MPFQLLNYPLVTVLETEHGLKVTVSAELDCQRSRLGTVTTNLSLFRQSRQMLFLQKVDRNYGNEPSQLRARHHGSFEP